MRSPLVSTNPKRNAPDLTLRNGRIQETSPLVADQLPVPPRCTTHLLSLAAGLAVVIPLFCIELRHIASTAANTEYRGLSVCRSVLITILMLIAQLSQAELRLAMHGLAALCYMKSLIRLHSRSMCSMLATSTCVCGLLSPVRFISSISWPISDACNRTSSYRQ